MGRDWLIPADAEKEMIRMTPEDMIREFGLKDGGVIDGKRAVRATRNARLAQQKASDIRAQKDAILAILDDKAAQVAAREAAQIAADAARSQWAIVNSGSYLMEWRLARVIALTDEEKAAQYNEDWAARHLYRTARGGEELAIKDHAALVAVTSRAVTGHLGYGESRLWVITDEEAAMMRATLEAAQAAHAAQIAATRAATQTERDAKIAQAAATGQNVVLSKWIEDCDASVVECSTDVLTEIAYPHGRVAVVRIHTF